VETTTEGMTDATNVVTEGTDQAAPEGERRERRSRDRYGRDRRGDRPGREGGAPAMGEGEVTSAPMAETTTTSTSASPAARAAMPLIQPYTLPVDAMVAVAQGAQLDWVQSNPDRVAQVQAAIAAEPKPIHVPRERPPVVVVDEGPLILVETRKDLGQVKMPFDA
jgi:ribonuclease E